MKKFLIICILVFIGCNQKTEKQEVISKKETMFRFYDLFYSDILESGKYPIVNNIDSLYEIKNLKNHMIWLKMNTGIDSLDIKKINSNQKITVSDTLIKVLKENINTNLKKAGVVHSFSRPYSFSKNQRLIFWESNFYNISHVTGVTFFSKRRNNLFALDSSMTLNTSSIR